jgi:hypothetical protein
MQSQCGDQTDEISSGAFKPKAQFGQPSRYQPKAIVISESGLKGPLVCKAVLLAKLGGLPRLARFASADNRFKKGPGLIPEAFQ